MRGRSGDRAKRARSAKTSAEKCYSPDDIIDAPEHHEYARAMGLLTWGTWDTEVRSFEDRLKDFMQASPSEEPARFQGSMLMKISEGEYGPAGQAERVARIKRTDNSYGALTEVLARYGLKLRNGAQYAPRHVEVAAFRDVTRVRNQRLRVLHGRVDIEADNMDEAKAAELDRREKKHAAEQIREARERMRADSERRE